MPVTALFVGVVGWLVLAGAVGLLIARTVARRELRRLSAAPPPVAATPLPSPLPRSLPGHNVPESPTGDRRPETGRVVLIDAARRSRLAVATLQALLTGPAADVVMVVTGSPDTGPEHPPSSPGPAVGDVAGAAHAAGIPLMTIRKINAAGVLALVRTVAPDLLIVAGWQQLAGELLAVPRRGCVGLELHMAAGSCTDTESVVSWAILRGESHIDTTMLMLGPDHDDVDIIERLGVRVEPEDTCTTLGHRAAATAADLLRRHLPSLLTGAVPRAEVGPSGAVAVLPARTSQMGVTDWSRSPVALHDWVRALTWPCTGAFTTLGGRTVMLWRARLPGTPGPPGRPGEILDFEPGGVRIACGDGTLVVTEMSERGQPPQAAVQWCRDNRLQPGTRFDQVPAAVSRWSRGLAAHPDGTS